MSIAQGILRGVQGAQASFRDQRDSTRQRETLDMAREQQDNANAAANRITRKDDARQLVSQIDGHLNSVGAEPASWNKTDGLRLLKDRPDLAYQMLNDAGTENYKRFVNEDGDMVGADIVQMRENDDGSYTPMMKRRDTGAVVPMTEGRTADSKDPVQKITPEHLEKVMNARYQTAVGDGGLENTNSYLANSELIAANMARQEALDLGVEKISGQDQLTQFRGAVEDIDIEEEGALDALLSIYKSVGGDPDELKARGQAKADAVFAENQEEQGGVADGSLQGLLADKGITKEKWQSYDPAMKKRVAERLGQSQGFRQLWDKTGGVIAADISDTASAIPKAIGGAVDSVRTSTAGRFLGLSDIDDVPADAPNYNESGEANQREIGRQDSEISADSIDSLFNPQAQKGTGVIPKGTGLPASVGPAIAAPDFELTANGVRDAILNGTSNPTDEQKAQVAEVLKANGIDTEAQLEQAIKEQRINKQEGLKLAWVMSATNDGTTTQKAAMAQKMTNYVERGDQDVGTLQQAQMNSAAAQGRAATANAQTTYQELLFKMKKYDQEAIAPIQEYGIPALNKVYKRLGLMDEDGEYTDKAFDGDEDDAVFISRQISGFIPRLKTAKGAESAGAGMDFLTPMLSLYLQSQANADKGGVFSGETYKDFFRLDPDGTTDFDLKNVRVGKMVNGKPVSLVYADQGGVRSQAVDISTIQGDSKVIANLLVTAAVANSNQKAQ